MPILVLAALLIALPAEAGQIRGLLPSAARQVARPNPIDRRSRRDLPSGHKRRGYVRHELRWQVGEPRVRLDGLGPGFDLWLRTRNGHVSHIFLTGDIEPTTTEVTLWYVTR